jgi:hypothetical protein
VKYPSEAEYTSIGGRVNECSASLRVSGRSVGWFGWLVGLVGLIGWLVGLIDWLVGWLVGCMC